MIGQAAIGLGAVAALAYGAGWCFAPPSVTKSVLKTAATVGLALGAGALGAPGLVVLGLWLGAAGDLALSRPGQGAFLAGMGAFAAGHLAYAAAFLAAATAGPDWLPLAALAVLGASTEFWLSPRTGDLRAPVRAYVLVILAMAAAALAWAGASPAARAGAGFFVLSDLLLAIDLFVLPGRPGRALPRAVWASYWGGQALIALGMAGVLYPSL